MATILKKHWAYLSILVLSFVVWKPLVSPGYFSMHDDQQIVRLAQLDKSLSFGQFPVRWVEDLGFGYGYPLFNFYPPLVYYLGEVFHLGLGASFITSVKLVWLVALVGSGIAMYFLAKEFFGELGGLVSALFYLYAPYHAVDAYVRGALAELFSFVWLPLILLFSYKIVRDRKWSWAVLTGIALGLLMITHNLIFLPFFGLLAIWHFSNVLIFDRQSILRNTLYWILYTAIALSLTAFFWLPALVEKHYTLVDQLLIKNLASYKIHFVCLGQLWTSPWGFGGSMAGCTDGMSFGVGKLYILTSLVSFSVAVYLWFKGKKKIAAVLFAFWSLLLLSIFMTTEYSRIIWDWMSGLWYLQFPWRFLEFVALFTSLLAGSLVLIVNNKVQYILVGTLLVTLILVYGKHFQPQRNLTEATDDKLTTREQVKWYVSGQSFEYLPSGIATKMTDLGVLWVDIDKNQIAKTKYEILRGDFIEEGQKFGPDRFRLVGRSTTGATIEFQVTNFPGWRVWIDGKEVSVTDKNKYKLITIEFPVGEHELHGRFTDTRVRTLGNTVSLLSVLTLISGIYGARRNKN